MKSFAKKIGLPPGELVYIGQEKTEPSKAEHIEYNLDFFTETEVNFKSVTPQIDEHKVHWININGLADLDFIQHVGTYFQLDNLILEDVVNTDQRPKIEFFEDCVFIVLKMLSFNSQTNLIEAEQLSLVLKNNCVVCFQEKKGDVFETIRKRIRNKKGRIRSKKADYLMYALMDAVVDHYFILIDQIAEKIEDADEQIINDPSADLLETIHALKREMIFLKKSTRPMLELVKNLIKEEADFFEEGSEKYLRDVLDHIKQINETLDSYREMISHLFDVYMSVLGHKTNQAMKVLTLIATIFIPLTFIVGVYGMNFEWMPELKWKWGYPLAWLTMLGCTLGSIFYFKKKKWF